MAIDAENNNHPQGLIHYFWQCKVSLQLVQIGLWSYRSALSSGCPFVLTDPNCTGSLCVAGKTCYSRHSTSYSDCSVPQQSTALASNVRSCATRVSIEHC